MKKQPIRFYYEDEFIDYWKDYLLNHSNYHLELYVHYPWCRSLCKFCVFGKLLYGSVSKDFIKIYEHATWNMLQKLQRMFQEINRYPDAIYFGGGTASLWDRDFISNVSDLDMWRHIPSRTFEIHPYDLSEDAIHFLADKFNKVSIGVQSFDVASNQQQHRIYVEKERIASFVYAFRNRQIQTNIDIVALLNGEDEIHWDIFKQDLRISMEEIQSDIISISPNFRLHYYKNSTRFREILKEFLSTSNYKIHPSLLSLDQIMILDHGAYPYKLYGRQTKLEDLNNKYEFVIGIGGYDTMTASSKNQSYTFTSKYQTLDKEFVFSMYPGIENQSGIQGTIQIGSITI